MRTTFNYFLLELLGDILVEKPVEVEGTDSIVVVDNVPSIPPDRLDKLKNVIRKVFSKFGKIIMEHYPLDDNGMTKGQGNNLHVQAYQLYPLIKPHSHVFLDTSVITYYNIISPSKTMNDQNSQKISMDYTENVDIEYQNKLPE